jgi:peptide/nickel transport system permease protein
MTPGARRRLSRLAPLAVITVASLSGAGLATRAPDTLEPARSWCAPSATRLLGCGEGGVDLLPLVAHAVARGLVLAVAVAAFGFLLGTPLGAGVALARGRAERFVLRLCDLLQAFPTFLLALAVLSAVRSPSRVHIACVFALTAWAPFARLAVVQTQVLREQAFVDAARALGVAPWSILVRHVLPNLLGVAAVQLGATGAAVVVSEAALGFVGFGPRDGVSLGSVMDQGVAAMLRAPHVIVVGAVAVFVTSASMLLAGRAADGGVGEHRKASEA